jgi:hypothetical protein
MIVSVMTIDGAFSRFFGFFERFKAFHQKPAVQRIAWGAAVIVFSAGLFFSIATQPGLFSSLRLAPMLVLLFLLCPAMAIANMAATRIMAELSGAQFSWPKSFKLAVMSTAANHLPIPGGPILRIAALKAEGASIKDASIANIALGLAWMSATFLFASVCSVGDYPALAAGFICAGALLFIFTWLMGAKLSGAAGVMKLMAINIASAAIYAISIYVTLYALGAAWSFPQAVIVATAGVIGAASSITPSGLGVREAAAAGLAVVISVAPAEAFAATAVVHIAMMALMGVFAAVYASRRKAAVAG